MLVKLSLNHSKTEFNKFKQIYKIKIKGIMGFWGFGVTAFVARSLAKGVSLWNAKGIK